jgi:acyl dehydratase
MAGDSELQFDRSVLGAEVEVGQMEVTLDDIRAYCAAIGETNPLYVDEEAAARGPYGGIIAPPTFYTVIRVGQGPDPRLVFGGISLNAGQHCEFMEPIRPGDVITASTAVHDVYEKTGRSGRMVFVVRRTTYRNQRGEPVAVVDSSIVHRQAER